jgi:hypothetical protein
MILPDRCIDESVGRLIAEILNERRDFFSANGIEGISDPLESRRAAHRRLRDGVDLQPGVEDFVMQVKQAWRFRPCSKVPI